MLALFLILLSPYYARKYAGIIDAGLIACVPSNTRACKTHPLNSYVCTYERSLIIREMVKKQKYLRNNGQMWWVRDITKETSKMTGYYEEKEGRDCRWTHFLLIWLDLQEGCRRAKLRRYRRSLIVKSYESGVVLLSKKSS